jgi:hypothetical protein
MCRSVFNLQNLPLGSANMVAKKEEKKKKKEKREKGKMTGSYFVCNSTYLDLIFCGPEQTEENW